MLRRDRHARRSRATDLQHARLPGLALALALVLVMVFPSIARGEEPMREPLVFVADPKFGVETSARTFDSVGRVLFRYEEVLPSITIDDDSGLPGKTIKVIGRLAKLVFLDEPLAEITTIATHEVGGHGARGRELGEKPTFLFYLPVIYRLLFAPQDKGKAGAFTSFLTTELIEEPRDIIGTLGGLEAQYTQAWWINARIVRANGWVHHGDMLSYAASKMPYADSFFSSKLQTNGAAEASNDIAGYVTGLQELSNGWRNEDRRRIARRLGAGYLWNLFDPTLLYSLYGGVIAPLRGDRFTQMPLPKIGTTTVFPSPRFNLTPFGAEQILDVFLARSDMDINTSLLDVYGRVGTSGLASYWGMGARLLGVEVGRRLVLGGELDMWRQPEILLDVRGLFEHPNRFGMNVGGYADLRITGDVALTGKLAAKTPGYVMAQPIAGGLHGYIGVSLAWR